MYLNGTLKINGSANFYKSNSKTNSSSTSNSMELSCKWSSSAYAEKKKNEEIKRLLELEKKKHREAILNYHAWKIEDQNAQKKKFSSFENRLEMTLKKKRLLLKQLTKKYYNYDFRPNTEKRPIQNYKLPNPEATITSGKDFKFAFESKYEDSGKERELLELVTLRFYE